MSTLSPPLPHWTPAARKEVLHAQMKPGKGLKRLNIHIDAKLHDAFKATTAARGEKMTDVLLRFIQEYVKKNPTAVQLKGGQK